MADAVPMVVGMKKTKVQEMMAAGSLPAFLARRVFIKLLTAYVQRRRNESSCAHCGANGGPWHGAIIWHHPDNDGHLGRVGDLVVAGATIEQIDVEIARCVPLCVPCHFKEHKRMRDSAEAVT